MKKEQTQYPKRKSVGVQIGNVTVGAGAPIVVQSMTNTDTASIDSTCTQIMELTEAGSELVRITVNNEASARAVPQIKDKLAQSNISTPLVGDFHFNGHTLLRKIPECAQALDKFRINPGNIGKGQNHDSNFGSFIEIACKEEKPVRIGVNWGSLDQELLQKMLDENLKLKVPETLEAVTHRALISSALDSAARAEELGLPHNMIILSCKLSRVRELTAVYQTLAGMCDYPLHIGLTEAGMGVQGIVASVASLSILLHHGIGDTIRISLTPEPGSKRTKEVEVAKEILQSMGLRSYSPAVTACPGCGRTTSDYFQQLAFDIKNHIATNMPNWRKQYPGVEEMNIAVMGCVVNGPGESKHADIGISLPGTGEKPTAPVYIDGEKALTLKGDSIAQEFQAILSQYIAEKYGKPSS